MANGKVTGARFSADETAWLEDEAKRLNLKGVGAVVAHLVRAAMAGDAGGVIASLPVATPTGKPLSARSGQGQLKAAKNPPAAGPQVRPGPPATPGAPPAGAGRVSVSSIEGVQHGRVRPAYGSLAKGGKGKG